MNPLEGAGIGLLQPHALYDAQRVQPKPDVEDANPFGAVLETALAKTNDGLRAAEQAGEAFAAGQVDDIHGTMLAMSQADIQLRMLGSMRNRVVDAFYELWRMQV
jgi:flagellar hook-basal body complex protein FliE